ncbi:MAG: YlzJ-like family protein [Thermaerobacter sp.]|nr:YlzJ-like family protein [Thermaerobacter sp.]
MVLYTPMAFEDIFPQTQEAERIFPGWLEGRLCLIRRAADGSERLERLLSTDPNDYLDPRFQPNHRLS